MEAGYDYLFFRRQAHRRMVRFWGIFCVAVGVMLLTGAGGYFAYALKSRAELARLNAVAATILEPPIQQLSPAPEPEVVEPVPAAFPADSVGGTDLQASGWANPLGYRSGELRQAELIKTFSPLGKGRAAAVGTLRPATQLSIPILDVQSSVAELKITTLDDRRAYETPRLTVGHIPETANAGEEGSAWFFGHLESPLAGEGSVFYSLPQIPEILKQGKDVYIVTQSNDQQFLYRVTSTKVVPQDQLKLSDEGFAAITLVTCVPKLVYDHRLVVQGELVGMR
ncbi:MAG: sortase [SAR202 cluster bacterium]|nr:sortase [SAR202 cluster bacterium]